MRHTFLPSPEPWLGFAIPVGFAAQITEQLLEDGTAEQAFLSLVPGPVTPQIARQLEVKGADEAVVLSVTGGSPADEAGVPLGDIVVQFDGNDIGCPEELLSALREQYRRCP